LFKPNPTVARDVGLLGVITKNLLNQKISVSVHKFMTCVLGLPVIYLDSARRYATTRKLFHQQRVLQSFASYSK